VFLDGSRNVSRVIGVNLDVTERKEAEAKLFAEKESAQIRLNSIGDAVICTDASTNINFFNSIATKLTGWPFEKAAGRPVDEVLRIKDAARGEFASNSMKRQLSKARPAVVLKQLPYPSRWN
jgi:diguanylate cyclase